jgi:hypothetical protein
MKNTEGRDKQFEETVVIGDLPQSGKNSAPKAHLKIARSFNCGDTESYRNPSQRDMKIGENHQ